MMLRDVIIVEAQQLHKKFENEKWFWNAFGKNVLKSYNDIWNHFQFEDSFQKTRFTQGKNKLRTFKKDFKSWYFFGMLKSKSIEKCFFQTELNLGK